jgi:hypothetical protein
VDWVEQSTVEAGERSDGKAGGYLQRLDVWRQRKPACTTAGPRLIGRVRDEQVKWRAGGGGEVTGPEIDARENSITIYNGANPDRITAAKRALVMWNRQGTCCLSARRVERPGSCQIRRSRGRTYALLRLHVLRGLPEDRKPKKRAIFRSSCPREPRSAQRAQNRRHPIAGSCLTPAKRDMAATGGEWLGGAGTVHKPKVTLVDLSYGKRPHSCTTTNRRGGMP